jgi:HSP20 family molecular chaperone IbpA
MKALAGVPESRTATVHVAPIGEIAGRAKTVHDLVARRAYELYEKHGRVEGHAAEDWSEAESEVLVPVPIGFMQSNKSLDIYAGVPGATSSDLEICVEPRCLTLCGHVPAQSRRRRPTGGTQLEVFRVVNLPAEVNPSKVVAKVHNGLLQIEVAKREAEAKAA